MSHPAVIYLATNNAHKVGEIMRSLELLGVDCIRFESASTIGGMPEVDETGTTLLENARIKAKALASKAPDVWVCADDTGLFVDALGGAPGVHTARYAGVNADSRANKDKLLAALASVPVNMRTARFVCCLCLISPEGREYVFEGVFNGCIASNCAGGAGFGYDPVFIPEGHDCSVAELDESVKNRISHRALAVKKLVESLCDPNAA